MQIPLYVCVCVCELSVMLMWSQSKEQERAFTDPYSTFPHLQTQLRYYGFQRVIFRLVLKMSLIISLEWMIISNQGNVCVWMWVLSAKWTGRWLLKAHMKMIERAVWRTWAKNPKKCSSKWGVPRLTLPLIIMLTPSEWSTVSPVLHVFPFGTQMWTFTSQHTSRHLSQQPR